MKHNALMGASYNLGTVEQRLILLAIVEARKSGKGITALDPLRIHASSYMHQFGVSRHTAYESLKEACKDLFARQFSYQEKSAKGKITHQTSRWVSQIGYTEDEASVEMIFAPAVVPFITRLEEQFTSYELHQISSLTSKYAIRLYEILMQWKSIGKLKISIEDLRSKLGLQDGEYTAMCDFKKHVLDLSIKQISSSTDITVDYDQHKKGRSISDFTFRIKSKQKKSTPTTEHTISEIFSSFTDSQRHLFGHKLSRHPDVQSAYSHLIGTGSYEDFAKLLAEMLKEQKHFETFYPLILQEGYKPRP